jgi:hypothetical protein
MTEQEQERLNAALTKYNAAGSRLERTLLELDVRYAAWHSVPFIACARRIPVASRRVTILPGCAPWWIPACDEDSALNEALRTQFIARHGL